MPFAFAALAATCTMAPADRVWLDQAVANWRVAERRLLRLAPSPLPRIIAVDARCIWSGTAGRDGRIAWTSAPHDGKTVAFPGGNTAPIGPISHAAPDADGAGIGYFAMSLPSVWRAAGVTSGLGLERLMDGVMLHELMHTRQFYFANPRLAELGRRYGFGDDISDDSLQDRFKGDPAYVAAWEAERDLLYAAAAAPGDAEARRLAGQVLAAMRARQARWFVGRDAQWQPLDDLFLTMEGLGQWLAYAWYVSPQGGAIDKATALREVRRKRNQWSQDHGLGLFPVIDRLVPGWRRDVFAAKPVLAEALLARAAGTPSR